MDRIRLLSAGLVLLVFIFLFALTGNQIITSRRINRLENNLPVVIKVPAVATPEPTATPSGILKKVAPKVIPPVVR